jgi:hypothetical protein
MKPLGAPQILRRVHVEEPAEGLQSLVGRHAAGAPPGENEAYRVLARCARLRRVRAFVCNGPHRFLVSFPLDLAGSSLPFPRPENPELGHPAPAPSALQVCVDNRGV